MIYSGQKGGNWEERNRRKRRHVASGGRAFQAPSSLTLEGLPGAWLDILKPSSSTVSSSGQYKRCLCVHEKIYSMGLYLADDEPKVPAGVVINIAWIRVHGDRVFTSCHAAQVPDGTVVGPFGRVGDHVTLEQASEAAKFATVSLLASVRRALGGGRDALD
ncbi:hypothetical protein QBC37DRAFT_485105 [Rhypophila decipiens]|uniref:Uncharacterized protein n=1 Tax=Rhypophila decipiens TaxID=261697 RepID=A0AAN6Y1F7_9PEZI|nr:hypothetical protein QBC37DRAFT_485105 [Rhypophila decipiens]